MALLRSIVSRLFLIMVGYVAATLAASAVLTVTFLTNQAIGGEFDWRVIEALPLSIPFVAVVVAYFTFAQSLIAIGIAETFKVRHWLYYSVAGALVGVCVIAVIWYMNSPQVDVEPVAAPRTDLTATLWILVTIPVGGMVGGIAYWAVAGRTAGAWRPTSPVRSGS